MTLCDRCGDLSLRQKGYYWIVFYLGEGYWLSRKIVRPTWKHSMLSGVLEIQIIYLSLYASCFCREGSRSGRCLFIGTLFYRGFIFWKFAFYLG
jgi:hypothetical protein